MDHVDENSLKPIRRKIRRRQHKPPPKIESLSELIEIAQSGYRYKNIDMEMLWRILPHLIDLDEMIGMSELKRTIFYQIIFYLQNLYVTRHDYLHTIIVGPPGSGKCLGKDTPILMYDGSIRVVQDIRVGDIVMGDDSTPRHVQSICQGTEQMYKIQNRHRVNASHIVSLVHKSRDEFIDVSISQLLQDGYEDYCMYYTSVSYPFILPEIDAYIAGYCFSGAFKLDNDFFVKTKNTYIESYLLSSGGFIKATDDTLEIISKPIIDIVTRDRPMDIYKINDVQVLSYFLGGMYDAVSASRTILVQNIESFQDLVYIHDRVCIDYETGIKHFTTTFSNTTNVIEMDVFTITLRNEFRLPSFISETNYTYGRTIRREPINIQREDVDTYYGFELDGNGRFVLANGLVTHNTSVARIIGEIYKQMGVLSQDGIFKIAKREDFVAEYLGQTAIKTKKLLTSCLGGVLFIDEVYALGPGEKDSDSFSKEAIDTLNVFLSENSQSFCCIVAGYEDDVKRCFFSVNQGLERRFQWVHRIDNYTNEELADIFYKIVGDIGWLHNIPREKLVNLLTRNENHFKKFGGDIEKFISKCKMCHAKRIFGEENPERLVLTMDDLNEAVKLLEPNTLERKDDLGLHYSMYI